MLNEVRIVERLSADGGHSGLVPIQYVFEEVSEHAGVRLMIAMPLASGGELFQYIANKGSALSERQALAVFEQLVSS